MAEIIKLAPGVSEVMRQRLGKIETVLTAEGVAGIQGVVEIDRDFWEALQYIHSAQTEMLAGNVHLAVQKYWDAYNLAVEKHGASLLSRQVVHSLVNSTIEVAKNAVERHNKTMNKKADITADIRTLPYDELMELQRAVAAEIQRREPKTRPAESLRPDESTPVAAPKVQAVFGDIPPEFQTKRYRKSIPEDAIYDPEVVQTAKNIVNANRYTKIETLEPKAQETLRKARRIVRANERHHPASSLTP